MAEGDPVSSAPCLPAPAEELKAGQEHWREATVPHTQEEALKAAGMVPTDTESLLRAQGKVGSALQRALLFRRPSVLGCSCRACRAGAGDAPEDWGDSDLQAVRPPGGSAPLHSLLQVVGDEENLAAAAVGAHHETAGEKLHHASDAAKESYKVRPPWYLLNCVVCLLGGTPNRVSLDHAGGKALLQGAPQADSSTL